MPTVLQRPEDQASAPRPRARRVSASTAPLIGVGRFDYADAFEIRVPTPDPRDAEHFVRDALEQAPRWVTRAVWSVQRSVLRLRLAPRSSPEHLLGWTIVTTEPDIIHLEAESPVGRGVIVVRRVEPTRAVVTTYLFFARPALGAALWRIVGPLHRRVAPYLMERAAATNPAPLPPMSVTRMERSR